MIPVNGEIVDAGVTYGPSQDSAVAAASDAGQGGTTGVDGGVDVAADATPPSNLDDCAPRTASGGADGGWVDRDGSACDPTFRADASTDGPTDGSADGASDASRDGGADAAADASDGSDR